MRRNVSDAVELSILTNGNAVAVPDRLGMVWVTGPDSVTFLDGLLSQNIAELAPGESARSLLLAPNGKMRATLFVLRGENRVGLVSDRGRMDTVIGDLSRFKIRVDATIERDPRPVYEVWGDTDGGSIPPVGAWIEDAEMVVVPMPLMRHSLPRHVVVGSAPDVPEVDAHGIDPVRIEAGEPVMGVDLDERTIPQEGVDVADHVDFTKGCYLGQELVARIDSRGHVNRRLAGLQIEGRTVPERGTPVMWRGSERGEVTSAAWSQGRELVVALAMVRVEIDPGDQVVVAERAARLVGLPMSD